MAEPLADGVDPCLLASIRRSACCGYAPSPSRVHRVHRADPYPYPCPSRNGDRALACVCSMMVASATSTDAMPAHDHHGYRTLTAERSRHDAAVWRVSPYPRAARGRERRRTRGEAVGVEARRARGTTKMTELGELTSETMQRQVNTRGEGKFRSERWTQEERWSLDVDALGSNRDDLERLTSCERAIRYWRLKKTPEKFGMAEMPRMPPSHPRNT
jgi:hypothetical protein